MPEGFVAAGVLITRKYMLPPWYELFRVLAREARENFFGHFLAHLLELLGRNEFGIAFHHDRNRLRDVLRAHDHFRELLELLAGDDDRRHALFNELRSVVDTPRRARASVG